MLRHAREEQQSVKYDVELMRRLYATDLKRFHLFKRQARNLREALQSEALPALGAPENEEELHEKDFFSYAFEGQKQEERSDSSGLGEGPKRKASQRVISEEGPKPKELMKDRQDTDPDDASIVSLESIKSKDLSLIHI